jgi:hypothetical protein
MNFENRIETDQELILGTVWVEAVSCYTESELDMEVWQWVTTIMGMEANIRFGQDCNTLGILLVPILLWYECVYITCSSYCCCRVLWGQTLISPPETPNEAKRDRGHILHCRDHPRPSELTKGNMSHCNTPILFAGQSGTEPFKWA